MELGRHHLSTLLFLCSVALFHNLVLANSELPDDVQSTEDGDRYVTPTVDPARMYFAEHFDDLFDVDDIGKRWIKSKATKDDAAEEVAKYDGEWLIEPPKRPILANDYGLVLKSKAKHAAIASHLLLNRPFVFDNKPLIVQYEVNLQDGQECGGSYIKLLSAGDSMKNLKQFHDKTPYTIMFGPDKCGNDVKLHFIFRHVNPINKTITEKHCNKQKERLDDPFKDKRPHLYQLIIRPDNTYTIRVDHKTINEGSLLTNFTPPVNPPAEIDDPEDKKPDNWDDREKIADPEATKPDDWHEDEPAQIPDPKATKPSDWLDDVEEMVPDSSAVKPSDWDNDMDGEWEPPIVPNPLCEKAVGCGLWKAPMIANPNYKGKWRPPLIANVNYQGKWSPRKIPNPEFFEDLSPFRMTSIAAVGIEIWSMSSDILFDNIVICDDETVADEWAAQTFDLKIKILDRQAQTLWERMNIYMNYKPAYWGAYFVYCSIPLIAYVWFLWSRRDKKSDAKGAVGHSKKTDEFVPVDDERDAMGLDGARSDKTQLNANEVPSSLADEVGQAENDDEGGEEDEDEDDGAEDVHVAHQTVDKEEEDDGESGATVDSRNAEPGDGLKKRKARKD
ncbi:calnexin-like isoform X1 [Anopheles cruzii]|uniref:calnexin-like isoform X1 n=1 Tax=Anopheles cruzii TaxID=68878 RepID=UPI0022EC3A77|nr:calnexin-like isoform X1 [Anopheles cruzii]XP_052861992.1 calnexin-like isoform X1 [Anopheles cruzii]